MGKYFKKTIQVVLLLLFLPVLILAISQVAKFISRASVEPANLVINEATSSGVLVPNWQGFSQGGESSDNMIKPAVSQIAALQPRFIRIDHLYDFYEIVSRDSNGNLNFNFAKLDDVVSDILKTGAKPFFSLSYMPTAIATSDIVSTPRNYNEWALTVQKTIERYSGKNQFNLSDIYYEVWNEPDLFGGFKYYGDKNYLELYRYSSIGARNAQNVNYFRLGGPATTAYYSAWMRAFLQFSRENNLKLDFVSWHRYTYDTMKYVLENDAFTELLKEFLEFNGIERMITESGPDSEVNPIYDGLYSAYHTASVFAKLRNKVYQIFVFEPVDGASPKGETFWGRWGLMAHPSKGLVLKPRYFLWNILNSLNGEMLTVTGENDFINVIPTKNGDNYKILMVNFDPENVRVENVPLQLLNIQPGEYAYSLSYPLVSQTPTVSMSVVLAGQFKTNVLMDHNSLAVIDLIKR
jgi:hypothetical protein